jgi:hypothetical protein
MEYGFLFSSLDSNGKLQTIGELYFIRRYFRQKEIDQLMRQNIVITMWVPTIWIWLHAE